ncbi:MAG: malonyl-CoA decarboxylase [Rhodospirillales bacterium]|nr:malonyl-CoA decarboxylase [Rhodospirillales bacterium]
MLGQIEDLCRALLSSRGEASGVAIARRVLDLYAHATPDERHAFLRSLAANFGPDRATIGDAWSAYEREATPATLAAMIHAVEPPRQELFRRLNFAPGGTAALLAMREDLLGCGAEGELKSVDADLVHLFASWFNRGFLRLRRIDWLTPADILERIIRYESVHEVQGWDDLQRRVYPADRRCFAFFHPSLAREPLIFVQVALTNQIPGAIGDLLTADRQVMPVEEVTTAVFYSISNCQLGLRSVSFGNFLIKQVVEELSRELPSLNTFVTLSPAPGFGGWLARVLDDPTGSGWSERETEAVKRVLGAPDWHRDAVALASIEKTMLALAAEYYLSIKTGSGEPIDPVARFHLGNGARLERLNWVADVSPKGLREAKGLMVNYLYDRRSIEANHEAYVGTGAIAASDAVSRHLRENARIR